MLNNYYRWQQNNGKFHPTFETDYSRLNRYKYYQYVGAGAGIMFAGTVWNPNFVNRRSWYMRKVSIALWGLIGFNFARRYYED